MTSASRRAVLALAAMGALAAGGASGRGAGAQGIRGFSIDALDVQRARERVLVETPDADTLRAIMRALSREPHEAGTPAARRVAEAIRDRFRAAGLAAEIEEFTALMPRPSVRALEIVFPRRRALSLHEPPLGDETRAHERAVLPPFNAYAADGDVTAEVVYANHGTPPDYAELARRGVEVRGRIVLVRYGGLWRGAKVRLAAEHGAVGCLLYSDPMDEGLGVREFPDGPARPASGVQRGSLLDYHTYPGDPLTPGWASVAGAPRLPRDSARTLAALPVLPLSYADALPILAALGGPRGGEGWRGALDAPYAMGPGPVRVRLRLASDWRARTLHDVIARIPGGTNPDELVILGNHHDAWVYGASDPISGAAAVLEVGRGLGALMRSGWRPRRTILLAAWDGEEWGLLGSTEWVEQHRAALTAGGVAYVNTDGASGGVMAGVGTAQLTDAVREIFRDVRMPGARTSLLRERVHWFVESEARDVAWDVVKRAIRGAMAIGPLLVLLLLARRIVRARRARRPLRTALAPIAVLGAIALVALGGAFVWARAEPLAARRLRARLTRALYDSPPTRFLAARTVRARGELPSDTGFALAPPGGTSDYVPFLSHAGLATLFYSHGGESTLAGDYHSRHDTYEFYVRFVDPEMRGARTQAAVSAVTVLRLADAPLLPYDYTMLARVIDAHLSFLKRVATKAQLAASLDTVGLRTAVDSLRAAAGRFDALARAAQRTPGFGGTEGMARIARANALLLRAERALVDTTGLRDRPWYRHLFYAPERGASPAPVPIPPGVAAALQARDSVATRQEAARVREAVVRLATLVDSAARALEP